MEYTKHRYILEAVESLRAAGSWTGKTHVQKTLALTWLVNEEELPFEFVLFKHGPFSFDVDRELDYMQSYDAVQIISQAQYGVTIKTAPGEIFPKEFGEPDQDVLARIRKVAEFVGSRTVVQLEALATSAWIRVREGIEGEQAVLARLKELKPHLNGGEALVGVQDSAKFLQAGFA